MVTAFLPVNNSPQKMKRLEYVLASLTTNLSQCLPKQLRAAPQILRSILMDVTVQAKINISTASCPFLV